MFLPDNNSKDSEPQISVLPPLFHQQTPDSQSQKPVPEIVVKPSRKSRFILSLYKLGLYGFWFGIGVGAANITRLFPSGWIVYLALMGEWHLVKARTYAVRTRLRPSWAITKRLKVLPSSFK